MQIYLVGGALRDELLGKKAQDKDYVVIGATERQFLKLFPEAKKVGTRQAVYIVNSDEYTLSSEPDIKADLRLRDLTINAVARDSAGNIIALPGALQDLEEKILRPISKENFEQDPLRIFRAARIHACLPHFLVHPALKKIMAEISESNLLSNITAERLGQEVQKAGLCSLPGNFIRLLWQTGSLASWFKELAMLRYKPCGDHCPKSRTLLEHTAGIMDLATGSSLLVWMGLCHHLAQAVQTDELSFGRELGPRAALGLGRRLRLPKKHITAGAASAQWLPYAVKYDHLVPRDKLELLIALHSRGLVREIFELAGFHGKDFSTQVTQDLEKVLSVRLPQRYQNKGPLSGKILADLRCRALSRKD